MKSKYSSNLSNPKLSHILNKTKKDLLIRKNGILFKLMKVYLIVPDNLKNLIKFKNNFFIYYPIRNSDFLQNKNIKVISKYNKYKICLTKRDIIDEAKFFLGINKNSSIYDFDLYNQNLGILKHEYQLSKVEITNNDNIIYIKIKLNKEHSEIKPYNDIPNVPKIIKFKENKSRFVDYIMKLRKKSNAELNLKKIINDTFTTINSNKKNENKRNYIYYNRNILVKKYKSNCSISGYKSNKIDKNTTTDDFTQISAESYKKSLINLKNINCLKKNIYNKKKKKKNLSSLDYYPNYKEKNRNYYKLKSINKYRTIRNVRTKNAFPNKKTHGNISLRNLALHSYQYRKKIVTSLYKKSNNLISRNKKNLYLFQPNIIKSYMEGYTHNLKNNIINDINSKNNI